MDGEDAGLLAQTEAEKGMQELPAFMKPQPINIYLELSQ